jgi:transcriptional regulator with XRE-family HTH domain
VVPDVPQLAVTIGARVRSVRGDRGWTLDDLADRSGVSRRMLVNVEQGRANPSIATLLRLSDALGVGLPSLVEAPQSPALTITRFGDAPVLWQGRAGGQARLVAGSQAPDSLELWDWTLAPGDSHRSEAHPAGTRELLLVLQGQVDLETGHDRGLLSAGDSAAFPGDQPHGYGNLGGESARFALTVFQPHTGTGTMR